MAQWESDLKSWAAGWDAVRGDAQPQHVTAWDGELPSEDGLVLVCPQEKVDEVRGAVLAAGKDVSSSEVLLTGEVQELDRGLGLPGDAGMFDAPMGGYTRFEVDEWGHPVAHSTLSVQDDVAFMGPLLADGSTERDPAEVLDPLVSAMANEAFLADAERLYTVVPSAEVDARREQGWQPAAAVLRVV